jgi:hypothetical protein
MVGIIPKPVKKIPQWQNILFYVAAALLIAAVLAYFIVAHLERKASATYQDLEERISQVGTLEEKELEKEVFTDKKRISDFAVLLQKHQKPSSFFEFLEETCHPRVWFSELKLSPAISQAVLSGQAPNFQILGQQLLIFQSQDLIQKVELADVSIGEGGETRFIFSLFLEPPMFKYQINE